MFDFHSFLKSVTSRPGVYQMLDKHGTLIYVGKAKNLKKRLSSYFQKNNQDIKTTHLVEQIHSIEIIVTETEKEAFLLENNLIKKHHPRYNILFRDDKSYPYIFLSHEEFPRITFHRGPQKKMGDYFGPYPHSSKVKETIALLQKLFLIRSCQNAVFKSRTRPCLQYQIHRCSAPCVKLISKTDYARDVDYVRLFLQGKNQFILKELKERMQVASVQLKYELAKHYRDQIRAIQEIQGSQSVANRAGQLDVIAIVKINRMMAISVLMIRQGQVLGHKNFLIKNESQSEVLETFVLQYYLNLAHEMPEEIILNQKISNVRILQAVLKERYPYPVKFKFSVRGIRAEWLKLSILNAQQFLQSREISQAHWIEKFLSFTTILPLKQMPQLIECFDVSHTFGEETVAACVVFNSEGPFKKNYRRFNIKNVKAGDDFAALYQALNRHYERLQKENQPLPDILIIDGGKGQLTQAKAGLKALNIKNILVMAIAKGAARKPGEETIYCGNQELFLDKNSIAFHFIQQIRDEAHRFAISGHRQARDKKRQHSVLENVDGIGVKRRQQLLNYFGGLQGVQKASVSDLEKVPGINRSLAQKIYELLHG